MIDTHKTVGDEVRMTRPNCPTQGGFAGIKKVPWFLDLSPPGRQQCISMKPGQGSVAFSCLRDSPSSLGRPSQEQKIADSHTRKERKKGQNQKNTVVCLPDSESGRSRRRRFPAPLRNGSWRAGVGNGVPRWCNPRAIRPPHCLLSASLAAWRSPAPFFAAAGRSGTKEGGRDRKPTSCPAGVDGAAGLSSSFSRTPPATYHTQSYPSPPQQPPPPHQNNHNGSRRPHRQP